VEDVTRFALQVLDDDFRASKGALYQAVEGLRVHMTIGDWSAMDLEDLRELARRYEREMLDQLGGKRSTTRFFQHQMEMALHFQSLIQVLQESR
jgi:hypothetical protein